MAFENFPYANFHELNLDWILERVKEAYSASNPPDYPVKSVNGMTGDVIIAIPANLVQSVNGETGDVILYRNPLVQFPTTTEQRWNLFRICDGDERGIEFDEDGAHRIEGTRRILIYDEENQPDFPVTSVNGQTGDVRITAGVNSVNGKTGNVVTPFINPNSDILKLDSNSNTVLWGLSRDVSGGEIALYITRGTGTPQAFIRYTPTGGQAINLPLLSSADIPAEAGVVSVNTKSGVVTLYGSNILTTENGNTIALDISSLTDAFYNDILIPTAGQTIIQGSYGYITGETVQNATRIRVDGFIQVKKGDKLKFTAGTNTTGILIGFFDTNKVFKNETSWYADEASINILSDGYMIIVFRKDTNNTAITPEEYDATTQIIPVIWDEIENAQNSISQLQISDANQSQQISAIQAKDNTQDQQITALQTSDTAQDRQITALQTSDTSQNQQIASLQSADTTHDQQISAIQAKDNTQDQQISELYTRTGVYVVSIPNANTLPLRYPASGTDSKIKDTNKVISMDLSIPGTQVYNWTITTYDGYLEIIGTMNGTSDITLYLA